MFSKIVRTVWKRLAMLGLIVTETAEPRVADEQRVWSPAHEGFAISLAAVNSEEPDVPPDLSIALKNLGATDRTLSIPDWMVFYKVNIEAPLSDFGQLLASAAANKPSTNVTIIAGKFIETDIPMHRLYVLERGRHYLVSVETPLGLKSNTVEIVP